MVRPRTGRCSVMVVTLGGMGEPDQEARIAEARRISRSPRRRASGRPARRERAIPGSGSPLTRSASAPSTWTRRCRVAPPVTISERGDGSSRARAAEDAVEDRPGDRRPGAVGAARSPAPPGRRGRARRRGPGSPGAIAAAGGIADHGSGRMAGERLDLREGDRMVAADHEQQRRLEPEGRARSERSGERPGEAGAAAPEDRRLEASSGVDQGGEIGLARGIAEERPPPASASAEAARRSVDAAAAELGRRDRRRPACQGTAASARQYCRPPRGDPLLGREGGRDHGAREAAARQAGGDLAGGIAAQQRIDFLVREVGAREGVEPGGAGRVESLESVSRAKLPAAPARVARGPKRPAAGRRAAPAVLPYPGRR